MTLFTQEKMRLLIDGIMDGLSMSQATARAYSSRSKIGWVHIRNSRKEKAQSLPPEECRYFLYDWPQPGEHHYLCDAFDMAIEAANNDFHLETISEIRQSRRPVLEGGKVQYEIDHQAIADWQGDAELARTLGGLHDPFYLHDANGARIPLTVRDRTSAALTLKALAAVRPQQWDRPQQIDVTKKSIKAVLTLHGPKEPSEMRRTLTEKLAELRANGPKNPTPSHPVTIMGRGSDGPTERVSTPNSDDAAKALPEPPRALPPPQPQISYARKRSTSLDATDRPTSGGSNACGMPSGGFDSKGRPT